MVPPAPDARTSGALALHSNRVSVGDGLRCRETGFPGRRKKRQYVARTTDKRSQRRSGRSKTPPTRGLSHACRKSPRMWDCVVADALQIEPVSNLKFPANREINREFCRFRGPLARFSRPIAKRIQWLAAKFPTPKEQGIFGGLTGNSAERTGNLIERSGKLRTPIEVENLFLRSMVSIVADDALILPHRANPLG
jgi:hypothetical protein